MFLERSDMNSDEFLQAIREQIRLSDLGCEADHKFLREHEVILGAGPFYRYHIPKALHILRTAKKWQDKLLGQHQQSDSGPTEASIAISQVVVIHNFDPKQCHRIRQALIDTGLINFGGPIYVNLSPFTRRTIDSLPHDAFKEAEYLTEYGVLDRSISDQGSNKITHPVVFMRDVIPTYVHLTFILGQRRQPEIDTPLPVPLYIAFVNVNSDSTEEILQFIQTYGVHFFTMLWQPREMSQFVSNRTKSVNLDLPMTKERLHSFWSSEQKKIRGILKAIEAGQLAKLPFSPRFPTCEDAIVEWRSISSYFSANLEQVTHLSNVRSILLTFDKGSAAESTVKIRRYYGWLSYMWGELADDVRRRKAAILCGHCGRVISQGSHGRPKKFCSSEENARCYKSRKAQDADKRRRNLRL